LVPAAAGEHSENNLTSGWPRKSNGVLSYSQTGYAMKRPRRRFLHLAAGDAALSVSRDATPNKRTFVMKLAAPTINDGTHEWMKGFAFGD
jgi:hypothetical protein